MKDPGILISAHGEHYLALLLDLVSTILNPQNVQDAQFVLKNVQQMQFLSIKIREQLVILKTVYYVLNALRSVQLIP